MKNYLDLNQFVDQAFEEVSNGYSDITKKELTNDNDRYELQLIKSGKGRKGRLILKKKGNGRPIPVVVVNAVSDKGENLFYRDQRLDRSEKVVKEVKAALEVVAKNI